MIRRASILAGAGAVLLLLSCGTARSQRALRVDDEHAVSAPAQPVPELRVVRSDARTFVVEYRPRYGPMQTRSGRAGQSFQWQDFDGAVQTHSPDDAGSPDLRYRLLPLGVPAREGNVVQILGADYTDVSAVMYAPLPASKIRDGMISDDPLAIRPERYSESRFLPSPMVELTPVRESRSMLVGGIRVYPLQYNPATRTLRRYTRLLLQVVYAAPRVAGGRDQGDDKLFSPVLLNYSIARGWQHAPVRMTAAPSPSVLSSGPWYRLAVTDGGIYKLDAGFFASAGISLSGLDPRTIRIFGNGGRELPETTATSRPTDLVENAITVVGESDGTFDAGDYVLFYGAPVRGWTYDPGAKTYRHYINHYSEVNYYWLTFGGAQGKRMQNVASLSTAPAVVPDRFSEHIAVEEERANLLSSGKDWLGQSVSPGGSFTYMRTLTGLVPNDQILYRARVVSQLGTNATMAIKEGLTPLRTLSLGTANGNYLVATEGFLTATGTSSLAGNQSQLSFSYDSYNESGTGWIDWIEILYPRSLVAAGDILQFRSPDTTAVAEYQVQNLSGVPTVFDVTSPQNVRMITGAAASAVQGTYTFRVQETSGNPTEYYVYGPAAPWLYPSGIVRIPNQNLRGYSDSTDFIIVTSHEFRADAERLAAFRRQPSHGGLKTLVVDVDTIYNEFAGGLPDMVAVRDYLKYAYDNWNPRPRFVLFFGGASYDYKQILGFKSSYVPTWQSPDSRDDVGSYATDDFLVSRYTDFTPFMVSGRLSCRTTGEAGIVVDKIMRYDTASVQDPWKMRMLFIGDDAWTSDESSDMGDGTVHSQDEEDLSSPALTPDELEKKKIYIAEYPTVWTSQGRRKPGAFQAIIDNINQGVLMVNYSGHGNPSVWAHERIFQNETSIPLLVNANKLSVFVLATCNFSQFDDAKNYTGSELLMNKPDGGSVGVISASRKVYQAFNRALNQGMHKHMFTRDAFGRVVVDRPATALFDYKVGGGIAQNDQKFFYMGDPTMRLQYPARYAAIDSINGTPVDSISGGSHPAVALHSLSKVTVSGTVRNANNTPDPTYPDGEAVMVVNDATRIATILDFYPGAPPWYYVLTGGTIYRGLNSVKGGRIHATFIVPKDVSFADSTARGRLVAYYFTPGVAGTDGVAYTSNVRITGSDSTAVGGGQGPDIAIYLQNTSYRDGDLVSENPLMIVDLSDSVGINTSGAGIGHRIEAWLNNSASSIDVTDFYNSKLDDYRKGEVRYQLQGLPQGKNTLRIRAWDSFNNSALRETYFTVASSDQLTVTDVLNYPNPFSSGTQFTFRQNLNEPLDVVIKVYTIAGRLIRSLDAQTNGDSYVRIPWDGRDRDGDILANGVYLYKVVARTLDGRFSSEALGKMSVLK